MAPTNKHVQFVPMGLMLAILACSGAASAQINPATPKNAAQTAAKTAGQSGTQSQNPPAKSTNQTAAQANASGQMSSKPTSQKAVTKQTAAQVPTNQKDPKAAPKPARSNATATKQAPAKTAATTTVKQTPAKTGPAPATQAQAKQTPAPGKQSAAKPTTTKPAPVKAGSTKSDAKPTGKTDTAAVQKLAPPVTRRDPFITLIGKQTGGGSGQVVKLPPGKAGLQVSTLILQGIVSGPNGMIAVVANPQKGVYFLHEGDSLFDGKVERIQMDAVTFHEVGKDAFGKPLERDVTKRLNASSGEQP